MIRQLLTKMAGKMNGINGTPIAPSSTGTPTILPGMSTGEKAYIVDSSTLNNPEIMSGSAITIQAVNGNSAMVYLTDKPHVNFTTSLSNISKEKV